MIFEGSRYARTEVIAALDSRGEAVRALDLRRIPSTPGVLEHVVMEGERLDQLAQRFYGDPLKSWLILDANPEELNPFAAPAAGPPDPVPQNQAATMITEIVRVSIDGRPPGRPGARHRAP